MLVSHVHVIESLCLEANNFIACLKVGNKRVSRGMLFSLNMNAIEKPHSWKFSLFLVKINAVSSSVFL